MKNFKIFADGESGVHTRTPSRMYEIGTQIKFYLQGDRVVGVRHIPVMFA